MVAMQEVERLLNRATLVEQGAGVIKGEIVPVARFDGGADLVYGVFPYQRRAVGVSGRRLIPNFTAQPVLAVKEGGRVIPLPYAEDIIEHPLREVLVGRLEALSIR